MLLSLLCGILLAFPAAAVSFDILGYSVVEGHGPRLVYGRAELERVPSLQWIDARKKIGTTRLGFIARFGQRHGVQRAESHLALLGGQSEAQDLALCA